MSKKLEKAGSHINKERESFIANPYAIWATAVLLVTFGLVMIYSASGVQFASSSAHGNDSMYLFKRQLIFAVAGFVCCFAAQFFDYSIFKPLAKPIYVLGIVSILLLKTPLGVSAKGATRWLNIMGIQFQVAEIVKICVLIILAYIMQTQARHLSKIGLIIRMWIGGALLWV